MVWWDMLGVKLLFLDQAELAAEEEQRGRMEPATAPDRPRPNSGSRSLPDPGASAGKAEAEAEASTGGSRLGGAKGSEGGGRLLEGGC